MPPTTRSQDEDPAAVQIAPETVQNAPEMSLMEYMRRLEMRGEKRRQEEEKSRKEEGKRRDEMERQRHENHTQFMQLMTACITTSNRTATALPALEAPPSDVVDVDLEEEEEE
ncbi:hypothetical protein SEPCBS119000_001034 [Sporothrix epigloea]|uniref:Uncharacterized protein n=1 Tax=Sporothrix epigloea TaxID=1892477 RepID=A0ABP0D8G7_9PEZI